MINQNVDNKANNYDVESYKKRKKEQKACAYKMIDEALEELKTNPESVQSYLNIQSRFDNYSPRNALLINKQCPNARQLKTKSDWLDEKANFINSKPNIITILEPGTPYEIDGKKLTSYNAKSMIDISETNLKYNVKNYDKKLILQALLHGCPVAVKVVDTLEGNSLCECNTDDKVLYVRRSDITSEYIKAVSTELAKIDLYESNQEIDLDKVNCIGYMLCNKYGLNVSAEGLDNLCYKFANMSNQDIIKDLNTIKEVFSNMNNQVKQYFDDKNKEIRKNEQTR